MAAVVGVYRVCRDVVSGGAKTGQLIWAGALVCLAIGGVENERLNFPHDVQASVDMRLDVVVEWVVERQLSGRVGQHTLIEERPVSQPAQFLKSLGTADRLGAVDAVWPAEGGASDHLGPQLKVSRAEPR